LRYARTLLPLALVASALVLCKNCPIADIAQAPYILAYTAEGMPEDVETELAQVRHALQAQQAPVPVEIDTLSGTAIWVALMGDTTNNIQVRVGLPVKDMASYINDQSALSQQGAFLADMGNGLLYVTLNSDNMSEVHAWLEQLRNPALALEGYAVVMTPPETWNETIDRRGYQPQALDVMRRLKKRWDPAGILNPGVVFTG